MKHFGNTSILWFIFKEELFEQLKKDLFHININKHLLDCEFDTVFAGARCSAAI